MESNLHRSHIPDCQSKHSESIGYNLVHTLINLLHVDTRVMDVTLINYTHTHTYIYGIGKEDEKRQT